MRVLYATYPMAFHTPGGGEIQLLAYKHSLEDRGISVDLLDIWHPNFKNYDLVHFFSCIGGSSHFCSFIKSINMPLVVSSSLWITEETANLYPVTEISTQLKLADTIVTNSLLETQTISRVFSLPRGKFQEVKNGVDDIFFIPLDPLLFRERYSFYEDFVLCVGNIEPRKNQLSLIRAMNKFPDLKVVLIGHIRNQIYFEQISNEASGQLLYVGPLDHQDPVLRSAYSACTVFCLPSTLETPGLAALEAAAIGCKLVITEVGSTREYFDKAAYFLNPYSVDSIVIALEKAVGKNSDNPLPSIKPASWRDISQKLEGVYESVVKNYAA